MAVKKNNIVMRTPRGARHKKELYFRHFHGKFFGYFPHIIVLFCVKVIRKLIHQCQGRRGGGGGGEELLLIEEGFQYIFMFSGVIGV